jgi:cobalt-precorrin 5A hydrolase
MDGRESMMSLNEHERFAIGFGCSTRATSEDLLCLIHSVLVSIPPDSILATLGRRAGIGRAIADALGLRLVVFSAEELASVANVTSQSERAYARTQTGSVAEAAALASLGPQAKLVVNKRKGRLCTCAVARTEACA